MAGHGQARLRVLRNESVPVQPSVGADYLQKFECIGPQCEDTCCAGWSSVTLDEDTYQRGREVQDPIIGPLIRERYQSAAEADAAGPCIKLNPDATCPFHDTDRLCAIQKTLGTSYLSPTCDNYPRISHVLNGVIERSGTLSCPEIARLALLNPEGITFLVEEIPSPRGVDTREALTDVRIVGGTSLPELLSDLRLFSLELLQDRSMPLGHRVLVLGAACNAISWAIQNDAIPMIRQILSSFRREPFSTPIPNVPSVEIAFQAQVTLLREILHGANKFQRGSARFTECRQDAASGLKITPQSSQKAALKNYTAAYHDHYDPFIREHEFIFENYLVNQIFRSMFPHRTCVTLFDLYGELIFSFGIIKTMIVGLAAHHRGLNEEIIVKVIQSFTKSFDHRDGMNAGLVQTLRTRQLMSIDYVALLLWPLESPPRKGWFS